MVGLLDGRRGIEEEFPIVIVGTARIPQALRATSVVPRQLSADLAEARRGALYIGLEHREDIDPAAASDDGEDSVVLELAVFVGQYCAVTVAHDYLGGGGDQLCVDE